MRKLFQLVLVAILATYFVIATAPNSIEKKAFEDFKIKFNKTYATPLDEVRALMRFIVIYHFVQDHNAKFNNDTSDLLCAINQFADLSPEELRKVTSGNRLDAFDFGNFTVRPKAVLTIGPEDVPEGPAARDWRSLGKVTPIKDQGYSCLGCWAFSSVAAIESALAIKYGALNNGSEQNLIDCNRNDYTGNWGCLGGSPGAAFLYVQLQPGLASGESYPYIIDQPRSSRFSCSFDRLTSIGSTTGFAKVVSYNETLLKNVVGSIGPVTASINSDHLPFAFYSSGVFDDPECKPGTSHSILIIGYGTAKYKSGRIVDYWLCKNSWSDTWGEKGYFRIVRGKNMCGIEANLAYPLV